MKISSIICEYNPFHAGHLYHIERTKQQTGCDFVIAVMSGSFVQRGLPAVYDKWARTDAALANGADLVLELPTVYACASAERFAFGGVQLTELTGIADTLSFGCETEDITILQNLAELFASEPDSYKADLKKFLDTGCSFAAARSKAAEKQISGAGAILSESNAILAIEYLKAIRKLGSSLVPCPILRAGTSSEQSDNAEDKFASARAVRNAIFCGKSLPEGTLPPDAEDIFRNCRPIFAEQFSDLLLYRLRTMTVDEIAEIAEVSEGLENKIHSAARTASSYTELLERIKSKRYPQSRLQRILANCLLGITKSVHAAADSAPFIRVLGIRKESRHLLSLLTEKAKAPVIISPTDINNIGLSLDIRATDIRSLLDSNKTAGRDFTEKLHIL